MSSYPSYSAAKTLYGNVAESGAPVIVLIPNVCKCRVLISFAVYEVARFFGIVGNDKEGVKLTELRVLVRNGIYLAIVLFFESLHLCVYLRRLGYPETAELFKEANLIFFLKDLYVRLVNVHPFHDFYCFLFLGDCCFHRFSSLDIIFECLKVVTDVSERFFNPNHA